MDYIDEIERKYVKESGEERSVDSFESDEELEDRAMNMHSFGDD